MGWIIMTFCGYKLRTNPRKYNLKEKLREQRSVEESKKN